MNGLIDYFVYLSIFIGILFFFLADKMSNRLTGRGEGAGAEEDAETRFEIEGLAGVILTAHFDAVSQLKCIGQRVDDLARCRQNVAGHQLERRILDAAFSRLFLAVNTSCHHRQNQNQPQHHLVEFGKCFAEIIFRSNELTTVFLSVSWRYSWHREELVR